MKQEKNISQQHHQIEDTGNTEISNTIPARHPEAILASDASPHVAEGLMRSLLESFVSEFPGVAIQRIDRNGNILSWNHASETLYGYPPGFTLGKNMSDLLMDEASRPAFKRVLSHAWQSDTATTMSCWLIKSPQKENLWVYAAFMPYGNNGGAKELFAIQIDATAHHQSEALLVQYKEKLETRVHQRTEELSDANEKLQQEVLNRIHAEKELLEAKANLEEAVARKTERLNKALERLGRQNKELIRYKNDLETLNEELLETNQAVTALVRNMKKRKDADKEKTAKKISERILPSLTNMMQNENDPVKKAELETLATHLNHIGDVTVTTSKKLFTLSAVELKVAHMIKNGFSSSEIARHLFVTQATVKSHRRNIRKKLQLNSTNINLRTYLLSHLEHRH